MDFQEIKAKTILTPCRIPGIDFVINPYIGCRFACKYCYASFMGRFEKYAPTVSARLKALKILNENKIKEVIKKFYLSQSKEYREELEKIIRALVAKYKMNLLEDMVIFHKEFQKRNT